MVTDLTGNLDTNGRDPDGHRDVVVHDIGDQRDDHAGLANLLAGAVSLNTGTTGNASLTNNKATVLGVSTVDGNLAVTDSTGNLTQTAGIPTVTGTSSFTTSGTNATISAGLGQSAGRGGVAEHQWHDRQCEPDQ